MPRPTSKAALAALVALVLAGCVGDEVAQAPSPSDGGTGLAQGAPPLSERVAVYGPFGSSQGESFIAVSPDGQTVLTCTHGFFKEPSPSLASTDAGATWRQLAFPPEIGTGGDCETALMPDGTWVFLLSTVVENTVATTMDGGATWTWSNLAGLPTNGLADRPWVEAAGSALLLTFMPLSPTPGYIGFTRSTDKAATWSQTRHITEWDDTRVGVMHGHLQVHADQQRVWVPLIKYEQPSDVGVGTSDVTGTLGYAVSPDGGLTWSETTVTPVLSLLKTPATMAVAGDRLYLAHLVPSPQGHAVQVWVSPDAGATWHDPVVVANVSQPSTTWIDGAADGTATMLVQTNGADFGFPDGEHVVGLRLDAGSPTMLRYVQDFGAGGNEFVTVDHDASGRAYASYGDGTTLWVVRELS